MTKRDKITSNSQRLYITRSQAKYRKVLNENEVISLLNKFGFQSVILESMSVVQQANLMSQAEAIVSPHGGGLTNLAFCPPGTKVIELFGKHVAPQFWAMSNCCGLEYFSLFCDRFETEKSALNSPQYNKDFLERIAQDIWVNLDSLSSLIKLSGLD